MANNKETKSKSDKTLPASTPKEKKALKALKKQDKNNYQNVVL